MIWHEIFGVETGVEALLSPTHLMLALGGSLMVSGPFRVWLASALRPGSPDVQVDRSAASPPLPDVPAVDLDLHDPVRPSPGGHLGRGCYPPAHATCSNAAPITWDHEHSVAGRPAHGTGVACSLAVDIATWQPDPGVRRSMPP